jgi:hypothetical protein
MPLSWDRPSRFARRLADFAAAPLPVENERTPAEPELPIIINFLERCAGIE